MSKRKLAEHEADQIEHEGVDADVWQQEPVEIEVRPSRTSVFAMRMTNEEFRALEQGAAMAHETLSQYVRDAVRLRQRGMPELTQVSWQVGFPSTGAQFGNVATWTENLARILDERRSTGQ